MKKTMLCKPIEYGLLRGFSSYHQKSTKNHLADEKKKNIQTYL